jgi:lipopolysaccharide transport system ATP-binding protein
VHGRIAPILALGAGFDGSLTGRENARIGGAILGLKRNEVERRLPAIAEFAGIGPFLDQQVKYYSTGMVSRLAFAVCAHADADILIIDEALAVGDEAFQAKCERYVEEFARHGTILMVSHSLDYLRGISDKVVWIDGGKVRAFGAPEPIIAEYRAAILSEAAPVGA